MHAKAESQHVRSWAFLSLAGLACFIVAIFALHWLQPGLRPLDEAISYYVHGTQGWLLTFGLLSLGLGSLALIAGLRSRPGGVVSRVGTWCLGLWSLGAVLGAIFAADPSGQWDKPPSLSGSIHGLAAMVALLIFPVGTLFWSRRLVSDPSWASLSGVVRVFAVASLLSLIAFMCSLVPVFIRPGPPVLLGLTERILFAVYVCWLAIVAVGLLRSSAPTTK
jgi:Protein of unknown function (DUF998)